MSVIKKHYLFIIAIFLLGLSFIPYYSGGTLISGGEGSYFLDFKVFFENYSHSWINRSTGMFESSMNYGFVWHLLLLSQLIHNERFINFVMIYSLYFLPFLAFYLLSLELGLKPKMSLLLSLFYLTNPFMIAFLSSTNQWNMLAAYILPSYLLIIHRYYNQYLKLFFIFGLNSLLFAFANANPPLMLIYQLAIIIFVFFVSYLKEHHSLFIILKNYLTIVFSFFLFNLWWIINWIYISVDAQKGYSSQFAAQVLRGSGRFIPSLWKTISLTSLFDYPPDPKYDYFSAHYSSFLSQLILPIPFFIVLVGIFYDRGKTRHLSLLALLLLPIGFMVKGVHSLFGGLYDFMIAYVPLFNIFKSPQEKWGILYVFLFSLLLLFVYRSLGFKWLRKSYLIMIILYLLFSAYPFVTGNFVTDYVFKSVMSVTRKFTDKPQYQELRNTLNSDPLTYRALIIPGSGNYQVALGMDNGKFYTGNDPIINALNKPVITSYPQSFRHRTDQLYRLISRNDYLNAMGIFNIKKIIINRDLFPWFGFAEREDLGQVEAILDKQLPFSNNDVIKTYDTDSYFLPRFYIPTKLIYSPQNTINDFLDVRRSSEVFDQRTAVYFNPEKEKEPIIENQLARINAAEIMTIGDILDTTDENLLRYGNESFGWNTVPYPIVFWQPGTFMYEKMRKDERSYINSLEGENDALFEQNLLLAAKRINEIQKWYQSMDEKTYLEILNDFRSNIREAVNCLERNDASRKDLFYQLVKIEVSEFVYDNRLSNIIDSDKSSFNKYASAKNILTDNYNLIHAFLMKNSTQIMYKFIIPEKGQYKILVENSSLAPSTNLTIDQNKNRSIKNSLLSQNNDSWTSFGLYNFEQGAAYLYLNSPDQQLIFPAGRIILKKENVLSVKKSLPQISFKRLNPAKYTVTVQNAADPYFLIFSENFHSGWKAYIRRIAGQPIHAEENIGSYFNNDITEVRGGSNFINANIFDTLWLKPIPEEQHVMMNGYANSWYITPKDSPLSANYEIIIEYYPERFIYIGACILALFLLFPIFFKVFSMIRIKKKDDKNN